MPADGLAFSGARTSAGTVMNIYVYICVCVCNIQFSNISVLALMLWLYGIIIEINGKLLQTLLRPEVEKILGDCYPWLQIRCKDPNIFVM